MRQQLRRTVAFSVGGLWGDEPDGGDLDLPVVRVADFDYARLSTTESIPTLRSIPASQAASRLLRPGDLLIEKSGGGDKQNVGRVVQWRLDQPAICSNFVNVLRPTHLHDSRFLAYVHRFMYSHGFAAANTKQTTGIQNLDLGEYLSTHVDLPDRPTQARLAEWLDEELARVDGLSDSLRRLRGTQQEAYKGLLVRLFGPATGPLVKIRYLA